MANREKLRHAARRGVLHIGASFPLVSGVFLIFRLLWPSFGRETLAASAGILVVAIAGIRELFDLRSPADPWWKSYSDVAGWTLGAAATVWLLTSFLKGCL